MQKRWELTFEFFNITCSTQKKASERHKVLNETTISPIYITLGSAYRL